MFMNKTSIGSAAAAALLALCASSASAQQSANITIDGTFVPPTCSVAIAGGGQFDWGTFTKTDVQGYPNYASQTIAKILPTKTGQLSVTCQQPTVVGLSWTDNRVAEKMPVDTNNVVRFGLGNVNIPGQALGGFHIHYGTPTTSSGGAINATFVQPNAGGAWSTSLPSPAISTVSIWSAWPGYVSSFGRTATSATTPVALLDYTIPLTIEAYVSSSIVANSTSTIVMDGSATVTLKYF